MARTNLHGPNPNRVYVNQEIGYQIRFIHSLVENDHHKSCSNVVQAWIYKKLNLKLVTVHCIDKSNDKD